MLGDRNGKMWSMFAEGGWSRRAPGGAACFGRGWPPFDLDGALRGDGCDRNWLEGTHPRPVYRQPAPALLGFDETIYAFCSAETRLEEGPYWGDNNALAVRCVGASENVLRVMGGWNMCVNLHWQTCAAKGLLHGQRDSSMRFSIAPKELDIDLFDNPPNGCVNGGCDRTYSISDVYYAEVCLLSHICRNRRELFELEYGELFRCDLDDGAYLELKQLLG